MDRASVEQSLRQDAYGSAWISVSKLRKWLGVGNEKFKEFTNGMQKRANGNRIEYFIPDVAERVLEDVFSTSK